MPTLPVTPGSIITFSSDFESPEEAIAYVATLIPGHITEAGEVQEARWASATIDSLEDEASQFTEEFLLKQDFEVMVETVRLDPPRAYAGEEVLAYEPGTVILISEAGDVVETATFAPSFAIEGAEGVELEEIFWVNSYGGFFRPDEKGTILSVAYEPKTS